MQVRRKGVGRGMGWRGTKSHTVKQEIVISADVHPQTPSRHQHNLDNGGYMQVRRKGVGRGMGWRGTKSHTVKQEIVVSADVHPTGF